MPSPDKPSLETVIAESNKKYHLSIGGLDEVFETVETLSTGNIALDHIIGGGIPRGRIVELYGPPSSGKTTAAIQTAVSAQRAGGKVAYLDYEHAVDKTYVESLGLITSKPHFIVAQPFSLEQGGNIARKLIETGEIDLLIFDSVAAMTPQAELEAETGSAQHAQRAKMMTQLIKQLIPIVSKSRTAVIFLNHTYEVIEKGLGLKLGLQRESTPGGRALKYYSSVRIQFKSVGGLREKVEDVLTSDTEDQVTAQKVLASVPKNKIAAPFKQTELLVRFGKGFSVAYNVINILSAHGRLSEQNGVFKFPDPRCLAECPPDTWRNPKNPYVRGLLSFINLLEDDPDNAKWLDSLTAFALELITVTQMPMADEDVAIAEGEAEELALLTDETLVQLENSPAAE